MAGGKNTRDTARETDRPTSNDPAAEALLSRFLSEVNGYRQAGNAALRELEDRLTALSRHHAKTAARQKQSASETTASSQMHPAAIPVSELAPASAARKTRSASIHKARSRTEELSLTERLRELTNHLHDNIPKHEDDGESNARAASGASTRTTSSTSRSYGYKSTPSTPVLDRAWFEDRFAAMRASIHHATDSFPLRRLEALEVQFAQLMERLDERDATANEGVEQVQASLKHLAVYLEDSKIWAVSNDKRLRGVEDKLSHLSGLVAQSHAAIAATAKGLEIVAKGTGTRLAHATADLVANQLEDKIVRMSSTRAIEDLNHGVASLSMQSRQYARSTDERFRQLQTALDNNLKRQEAVEAARKEKEARSGKAAPAKSEEKPAHYVGQDFDEDGDDDHDHHHERISPAQRASRLAKGGAHQSAPQGGEPLRYQIPYGEFLPDEERKPSNIGLVIAAVILLLASAAMLYLNLRDKDVLGYWPLTELSKMAVFHPAETGAAGTGKKTIVSESVEAKRSTRLGSAGVKQAREMVMPSGVMLSNENALKAQQKNTQAVIVTAPSADKDVITGKDTPAAPKDTGKVETEASVSKAAIKGDLEAQFHVGQKYLTGHDTGNAADKQERLARAVRWFQRAAKNGHVPSQYRLATLYELGRGTPKNYVEASKWYSRAAEAGHVKAMHNLAVLLAQGQGVQLDHEAAAKWFQKAADHGLADSQYNLAVLYERGFGVEQNAAKAYQWYALAARHGDRKAMKRRDAVTVRLSAEQISEVAQNVANWSSEPMDVEANGAAPEPPAAVWEVAKVVTKPEKPQAQAKDTNAAWATSINPLNTAVVNVQEMLKQQGFKPGPMDGIAGPRTVAAIREFEKKNGLPVTGSVSEALIARLKIAQNS
jgi:TPR repeat protein